MLTSIYNAMYASPVPLLVPSRTSQLPCRGEAGGVLLRSMKHDHEVTRVVVNSGDGRVCVSCSVGNRVHVWDVASSIGLRTFECRGARVWDVAVSGDGHRVAAIAG